MAGHRPVLIEVNGKVWEYWGGAYRRRLQDGYEERLCRHCGEWKPRREMDKSARKLGGMNVICLACRRRHYAEAKADGACVVRGCGRRSLSDRIYCEEHLNQSNAYSQSRQVKARAGSICYTCGWPNLPGHSYCEEHLEKCNAYGRSRYAEAKADGLCARCDQPSLPSHTLCDDHLTANKGHDQRMRVRRFATRLCTRCGRQRDVSAGVLCGRCALDGNIGRRILEDLRSRGASKAGRSWESLVGYTSEELHAHVDRLKSLQGLDGELTELHHIIPLSSFSYLDVDDPEFRRAWALDNLIPLAVTQHDAVHHGDLSGLHPKVRQAFEMVEGN